MNIWKPPTKKKDEGKPQGDTKPPKSSEPEKPQENPKTNKPKDDPEGTEGTGNVPKVTKGYDVTPLKSTYQERLNQTPVNNGKWTGEEANQLLFQISLK
ncbi:hypothetical protein [Paenibacillus sp. 1A_MP2]|uniref:hypothetical protein n=1 Tax=Paenibacillus sp. 1A_MP2 TaxID=3457495 RepID=UPI003FCE8525